MAKIVHFCFEVSDLDSSIDFYSKAFGLVLADRHDAVYQGEPFCLAYMRCPETTTEIELLQWLDRPGVPEKDKRETHLAVVVDDLMAEHLRLKRLSKNIDESITTHAPNGQIAGHYFFVHDPDGNAIEVFQRGGRYR